MTLPISEGPIDTPPRSSSPVHGFGTRAVHAGSPHDPVTGAVIAPISLSTTFAQTAVGQPLGQYEYVRAGNPNRDNFEKAVAALENAKYALAFSSGSATTAVILQSLASGSHVVSISDVYGGTHRYFTKVALAHGVHVTFTPSIEVDLAELIKPGETKLIWIETPSNPTLSLTDIRAVATIAHRHGIKVVVDNTFLSPYIQNPLNHGADIVVHSVTKYINGHSDVLMGAAAFNDDTLFEKLGFLQNAIGAVPSAFDCWLAHRGLKTLHLRAREATTNATVVAKALEASPNVIKVNYPGLASHAQHKITLKQHRNGMGGGMLSFRIQGGKSAAEAFCAATKIFTLAESLGGVESLVEVPASMTHMGIPKEQREAAGVFDDLVRISCGIEDAEDLRADIMQALEKAVVGPKISNGVANGNGHP
ncbi:cystathionine gamma-lyase-like protein [Tothia fuscella]|uniref:cystathionine gamma-lyase n=1 Tax=Tothia fuscella TaxID=1048955 RepID=A0A9P4U416_9PEZI|nr:cystathionine gamma-lyase-like protein [Tothia fuscella]